MQRNARAHVPPIAASRRCHQLAQQGAEREIVDVPEVVHAQVSIAVKDQQGGCPFML